ncbi:MAG: DAK2 domain-containing protein [Actinomycetota bacterium]|nr:DAK2 domain-containing protein [Actinomycetota bacterium]
MNDLERAREIARVAAATLEQSRERIDDLNVYPVPDGDTGTNMTLTAAAVVDALDRCDARDRSAVAAEVTRAALLGARGNSGVILSQILRGACDVVARGEPLDVHGIAACLRGASEAGYAAVREPVEGTILTVTRVLAEEAEERAPRAGSAADLLVELVGTADEALARTQEQLDVLRNAGVVDAGAAGLVELVRGIAACVGGEPVPAMPAGGASRASASVDAAHREQSRYRYCTGFVVEGDGLDAKELERALEPLGDSLLVVGDATALKVHVHTDDPGAALRAGTRVGVLENVEIANMHRQTAERERRLRAQRSPAAGDAGVTGVVAVVAGAGNRRLFETLGAARIVEGGQTMNPSTEAIVAAIESVAAPEALVLPNNGNVILTAEQAAALAGKPAQVVPSDSLQAGLAAMVAFDGTRSAAENAEEMRAAAASVATGAVTTASREVELNGDRIPKGAFLGLVAGSPVAGGSDFDEVAATVVEHLLDGDREVLTLLTGEGAPDLGGLVAALEERHPDVDVEVEEGGQPHYPLLVSAE